MTDRYDVVILGGGMAGLTLARHLLLDTNKTVLVVERRDRLPPERQKVGESTVQLAGYYLSKVLELEEYLNRAHLMKYNLRFYWPTPGRDNGRFEDYGQSYIRSFSNVASYQVDRNRFEADLLALLRDDARCTVALGIDGLEVDLAEAEDGADPGPHTVRFRDAGGAKRSVAAGWVVDATGRRRFLARRDGLEQSCEVGHGALFWWVDGTVDVEKLTDRSRREIRLKPERAVLGHLPPRLATNHFCAEGVWFWVIPLHGKTSLGLVYDTAVVSHEEVFSVEKATRWVCEHFPLFARDLPERAVLDFAGFRDYSHDCGRVLSPSRWAMTGESGRFHDPLYSPGSDLIALHNTVIVDLIQTDDPADRAARCPLYEQLLRSLFQAYVPSFSGSYDALGDQETMVLKYVWELAVYFAFYVFPFINDLFTERRFLPGFLRQFARLGPLNRSVHGFLSGYFQWKKEHVEGPGEPVFFDFMELGPLQKAEATFYRVGVSAHDARDVLAEQVASLEQMVRLIAARAAAVVLGEARVLRSRAFVEGIDPENLVFDPADLAARWAACAGADEEYPWPFDPTVLDRFDGKRVERPDGAPLTAAGTTASAASP